MVHHLDRLDHLVLAGPDLAALVTGFAERTGVTPVRGGSHTGRGTANFLVGLGGAAYLELIGPDLEQGAPPAPRPFGIDELTADGLVTWAIRPDDLDATVAGSRAQGRDPGDAAAMSRQTPDGNELRWRLTPDHGVVPFLIDWGSTTHPTASGLPTVALRSVTVSHPEPGRVARQLAALGLPLDVDTGDTPGLSAVLDTPLGIVTI